MVQAESDVVRTKARQDVDLLLGKNTDSKPKKGKAAKDPNSSSSAKRPADLPVAAEKKALPGIRGKVSADDTR